MSLPAKPVAAREQYKKDTKSAGAWPMTIAALLAGLCFGIPAAAAERPRLSLYSEALYAPGTSNVILHNQLKLKLLEYRKLLHAYAGLNFDQDVRSSRDFVLNDNHVAPLAGLEVHPVSALPVVFFAEYRRVFRVYERPDVRKASENDPRTGAYGYQWWDITRQSRPLKFFDETYGTLMFVPRLGNDLWFQAWSKAGARYSPARALSLDGYLELRLERNRPASSLKVADSAGPGLRVTTRLGSFSTALSARTSLWTRPTLNTGSPLNWDCLLTVMGELK